MVLVLPQAQLPADHASVSIRPVGVAHRPPLAVQVNFDPPAARRVAADQPDRTCTQKQTGSKVSGEGRADARWGRALVAVAVGPADGSWVLPEEAPRVGLAVRVPAVAVVPQPPARVLHDVVWELGPLQAECTGVGLGDGAVVVAQLGESLGAGQRVCTEEGGGGGRMRCSGWNEDETPSAPCLCLNIKSQHERVSSGPPSLMYPPRLIQAEEDIKPDLM